MILQGFLGKKIINGTAVSRELYEKTLDKFDFFWGLLCKAYRTPFHFICNIVVIFWWLTCIYVICMPLHCALSCVYNTSKHIRFQWIQGYAKLIIIINSQICCHLSTKEVTEYLAMLLLNVVIPPLIFFCMSVFLFIFQHFNPLCWRFGSLSNVFS